MRARVLPICTPTLLSYQHKRYCEMMKLSVIGGIRYACQKSPGNRAREPCISQKSPEFLQRDILTDAYLSAAEREALLQHQVGLSVHTHVCDVCVCACVRVSV